MIKIIIFDKTGQFAENKDTARNIRVDILVPALERNEKVVIDFGGVTAVTQSFIHALLSSAIRKYEYKIFDRIEFTSCNDSVRQIISVVADYMQDSLGEE